MANSYNNGVNAIGSFLNGTTGQVDNNDLAIQKLQVRLGSTGSTSGTTRSVPVSDDFTKIEVKTGQSRKIPTANFSQFDNAPALPSGYSPIGLTLYGDGKAPISTTYAIDVDKSSQGHLVIGRYSKNTVYQYGHLST